MNAIEEYNLAKVRFYAHFKYTGYDYGIEDETTVYWSIDDNEVHWGAYENNQSEYSNEVRAVYRTDDLTMLLVYNCQGERYLQVFDNSKKREV